MSTQSPTISALVCTRNRGASVTRAVESILSGTHPRFELIVVDQSTDDRTEEALAPFRGDPRLRYVRSETVGVSRARNLGIARSRADLVAITDDDCKAPAHWLEAIQAIFEEHPQVAVAFCGVEAAPHDPGQGFIPAYRCQANTLLTRISQKCRSRGIGAGMAVRRAAALGLGGFDEMLGPGASFPACEDGDMAVRALLGGHQVYETRDVSVLHFGYRTYAEGRELSRRDWLGIGAAYAKPLRCGRWDFWPVPTYEFLVMAVLPPWRDLARLRRPRGVTRIAAFLRGFMRGLRTPVDPVTLLFRSPPQHSEAEAPSSAPTLGRGNVPDV